MNEENIKLLQEMENNEEFIRDMLRSDANLDDTLISDGFDNVIDSDEDSDEPILNDAIIIKKDKIVNNNNLLLDMTINNNTHKINVDTSIQKSILTMGDAKRYNLLNKIIATNEDTYIGYIFNCEIYINQQLYYFNFYICRESTFSSIGLDNLRRYKAVINLENNYIKLGDSIIKINAEIDNIYNDHYYKLLEFGFDPNKILITLKETKNNFDLSLNKLINNN